jgi:sugar phosphate isomerase/epimerase
VEAAGSAAGALISPPLWAGALIPPGVKAAFAADFETMPASMADSAPQMQFPTAARERIAIASYPFREFIAGHEDKAASSKMELKEFAAHVSAKFNIKKIEPWSDHFRSLEKDYLEELRAAVAKAGAAIVNIAVDGEHSPYGADAAERYRAIAFSKKWIDAAVLLGSPSVRTNIPPAKDALLDLDRTADSLKLVAEYGAAKNILVNLENDNPVSEDPYFLAKLIEKVNNTWLHALPDFGNSVAAHPDEYAYKGIEGMFRNAYNISHVKETEVGANGKIAHVDLARTFGIAKKYGYKGYFSMEWDSPGDPYEGTAGLIEKTLKNLA